MLSTFSEDHSASDIAALPFPVADRARRVLTNFDSGPHSQMSIDCAAKDQRVVLSVDVGSDQSSHRVPFFHQHSSWVRLRASWQNCRNQHLEEDTHVFIEFHSRCDNISNPLGMLFHLSALSFVIVGVFRESPSALSAAISIVNSKLTLPPSGDLLPIQDNPLHCTLPPHLARRPVVQLHPTGFLLLCRPSVCRPHFISI